MGTYAYRSGGEGVYVCRVYVRIGILKQSFIELDLSVNRGETNAERTHIRGYPSLLTRSSSRA
jgi:hypothetical protein